MFENPIPDEFNKRSNSQPCFDKSKLNSKASKTLYRAHQFFNNNVRRHGFSDPSKNYNVFMMTEPK